MSAEGTLDQPIASHEITEVATAQRKWTLSFYPDRLRLQAAEDEPHEVARTELPARVQTIDSAFLRRVLIVTFGKKKVNFKLSPEAFAAVTDWIGPPTVEDLKVSLKRRLAWVVPIGFLFVLTSLPIGDLPWEPVSFSLGLALLVTATLANIRPHRILFALDSLWFVALAGNTVWLLIEQWSWWQLVLLLLQLTLVRSGWREYQRFSPERMAPEA